MRPSIIRGFIALVVVVILVLNWRSNNMLEKVLSRGSNMEAIIKNEVSVMEKPTCTEVPTNCGFPITFYQHEGESMAEFAKRIKREVAEFEKNWGG